MIGEVISGHMTADSDARAGALRSALKLKRLAKVIHCIIQQSWRQETVSPICWAT